MFTIWIKNILSLSFSPDKPYLNILRMWLLLSLEKAYTHKKTNDSNSVLSVGERLLTISITHLCTIDYNQ